MNKNKSFAFKLAQNNQVKSEQNKKQWKAREGVSVAGCTGSPTFPQFEVLVADRFGGDQNLFC